MHYAHLAKSKRLQRTLRLLSDGQEHSTRDIIRGADVCAVNSVISELRANGIPVRSCVKGGIWFYRLGDGKKPRTTADLTGLTNLAGLGAEQV